MSKKTTNDNTIAKNKKALHDYFIEEHFEAGIALQGWEVKALRAGRVQLRDAHVLIRKGEVFLFGSLITPLLSASTHVIPDAQRTRKLLLHKHQIAKLIGASERDGYTLIPLNLYWKGGFAKADIAIARGKKDFDKRQVKKDRDWQRQKARVMKAHNQA